MTLTSVFSTRKILPLLLLATLLILALPQVALARDHQDASHSHDSDTKDDQRGHGDNDHSEARDHEHEDEEVQASFHIRLEGSQQVSPVDTAAFGFAKIQLVDNTTLEFRVVVCDIANVTHSHIHVGASGTNGPIIIHFFDNTTSPFSSTDGCATLAEGTRTPSDLMPAGGINTWNDFVHALETNDTYVNVHTTANPGGEIRGQIIPHAEGDRDQNEQVEQGDAESRDD